MHEPIDFHAISAAARHAEPVILAPGAGPIDGHDEDDDMRLLRDEVDTAARSGGSVGSDGFIDAYTRRNALLRRTAAHLGIDDDADPLTPRTIRICASWLLSN